MYTISFERALELLAQPKQSRRSAKKVLKTLGPEKEGDVPIEICEGRYGPYVTDGSANRSVPKDADPMKVTRAEAQTLLDQAPKKKRKAKAKAKKKKAKSRAKPKSKAKAKTKAKE